MLVYKCSICSQEFSDFKKYQRHNCGLDVKPNYNSTKKNRHSERKGELSPELVDESND